MSSTSRTKSVAQQLIEELKASEGVEIKCPCCDEKRSATKYVMFAAGEMPGEVKALLKAQEDSIKAQSARHVLREQRLENAALNSQRINFGRFAENLIPAIPPSTQPAQSTQDSCLVREAANRWHDLNPSAYV